MRTQEFNKEHFSAPSQPMEFIVMDLIGEFHPASSKGNRYALTVICMLTGFTFCIPLKNKTAEEVVKAYLNHVCCAFGPSRKILTDNGTEFKNKMWEAVHKLLRTEHRVTPIYSPQCNGRIEGFHKFLKATVGKQLQKGLEWDDVVWKATSAYNFFPTESSGNSPFFLMFRREAAMKHMLLAEESAKYVGDDQGILNLKLMQQLYHVVAYNLAKSRAARDGNKILKRKNFRPKQLKIGSHVLVRDHDSKVFQPRATDHLIVNFYGNRVLVKDNHGKINKVHRKDVQPIEMDIATAEFFRQERENSTIRDAKHVMPIKQIPDLKWVFDENVNQTEVREKVKSMTELVCTTKEEKEPQCECSRHALPSSNSTPQKQSVKVNETRLSLIKEVEAEEETSFTSTSTEETEEIEEIEHIEVEEVKEQVSQRSPQMNNSIVTKLFCAFRTAESTIPQHTPNYELQF